MKKIVVAMFMGLFIFGGITSLTVCKAYTPNDVAQWAQNEQIRTKIAETITVTKDLVSYFMNEGYAPRDIVMAGLLAGQNNNTSVHVSNINGILAMKTSNNSWQDVASTMGVDQDIYNQYVEKAKNII